MVAAAEEVGLAEEAGWDVVGVELEAGAEVVEL